MFFKGSTISPDKKKQPHQIFERIISKPDIGIQQLGQYIRVRITQQQQHEIQRIINYIFFRNNHQINLNTKLIIISIFQTLLHELKHATTNDIKRFISQIIESVLTYFKDPSEKVRYQAIMTIYNQFLRCLCVDNDCLIIFTKIFSSLIHLVEDQNPDIKIGVTFTNHLLKKLLNDAVFDHEYFDINQFMSILIESFIIESIKIKQFLIQWLISIDEIPDFQISFYLPLVFKEIFKLFEGGSSQHKSLKDKSQECLKNFLAGFRELLRNRLKIEKKIRQDSFSMLIGVLLEVTKQALDPDVKYHALEWLQVFTLLFYNELIKKDHVEVRQSFRGQYLLKEMKEPKNLHRQSKILTLIREQALEGIQSNNAHIDFLSNLEEKASLASQDLQLHNKKISYQQDFIEAPLPKNLMRQVKSEYTSNLSNNKVTEFLVEIFLSYYNNIIILVMHSFSDENQKIRKLTLKINNILLDSFPIVQDKARIFSQQQPQNFPIVNNIITTQSQRYLQKLQVPLIIKLGKFLKQSRSGYKIQAIIKWIKILYQKGTNPQLNLEISSLIQKIVQKICQKTTNTNYHNHQLSPATSFNKELFTLLSDSIFMEKYLDLFIETLLSYFYQNQHIDSEKILIDVISMNIKKSNSIQQKVVTTEVIYITILKRLVQFETEKQKFKQKMIQNIISILITQDSLWELRKKLKNTSLRQKYLIKSGQKNPIVPTSSQILELIKQLFSYFCLNEGFCLIFCYLVGMYDLISMILNQIALQNSLDRQKLKSFLKATNLLECYNLNHFHMDMLKNQNALKAYLGYLMVIPISKVNKALLNKFLQREQNFIDNQQQEDNLQEQKQGNIKQAIKTDEQKFQYQLFNIYLLTQQKYKSQIILIQKNEQKKRQRQRQRSVQKKIQKMSRQNSLIKPSLSTSKVKNQQNNFSLKQSESQKKLTKSGMFGLAPSKKVIIKTQPNQS